MQIRFDLVKTAYALIWTEGGRGPFAVLTEPELEPFLKIYVDRKIKTYVYITAREK
jgi:hypothetical protein